MSDHSAIEWTETTWNPTTGCDRISKGCDNCYALTLAKRLKAMGSAKYQTDGDPRTSGPGFGVATHDDALTAPLRWRAPRVVFVNSMSDLFHARVPREFIAQVFHVMASTPQHTYQVLTKRATRLRRLAPALPWPANVWMGVSVEDAEQLPRVDELRQVPAATRFLSCEPLLGPLDGLDLDGINWVIAGGESGPAHARPMHPAWARHLRDLCAASETPYFMKQWGRWAPTPRERDGRPDWWGSITVADDGTIYQTGDLTYEPEGPRYGEAIRAGHDRARLTAMYPQSGHGGRLLDGQLHDAMPERAR